MNTVKDSASFCYCAYVLRISGYSSFLRNLPTNTTTFLHGLWLCGESSLWQGLSESKKKLGATTHFSEIIELKFGKKLPYILCILALFWNYGRLIISKKMRGYPHFSFLDSNNPCQDLLFPHRHNLCRNTSVLGGTFLNYLEQGHKSDVSFTTWSTGRWKLKDFSVA